MSRKKLSMSFQLPSLLLILISSVAGVGKSNLLPQWKWQLLDNLHTFSGNLNIWNSEKQSLNSMRSNDVFFEILEPSELEYTYKIVPASGFGVPFVSLLLIYIPHLPNLRTTSCSFDLHINSPNSCTFWNWLSKYFFLLDHFYANLSSTL